MPLRARMSWAVSAAVFWSTATTRSCSLPSLIRSFRIATAVACGSFPFANPCTRQIAWISRVVMVTARVGDSSARIGVTRDRARAKVRVRMGLDWGVYDR